MFILRGCAGYGPGSQKLARGRGLTKPAWFWVKTVAGAKGALRSLAHLIRAGSATHGKVSSWANLDIFFLRGIPWHTGTPGQ